jgi:hypothetical protein
LLETVETDAPVFLLLALGADGVLTSFGPVLARESQENGPGNFLGGGAGGCGGRLLLLWLGGAPHGTDGREGENPWNIEPCFELRDGAAGTEEPPEVSTVGNFVSPSVWISSPSSSLGPARLTSSREEVDNRCVVNNGDFGGFSGD